jgi:hypothetical protein
MAIAGRVARAQEAESAWTSRGELGLEGRAFPDDDDPITIDQGFGMFGRLELRHRHGRFEEKARGFGRLDAFDRERTTLIGEELWAQVEGERLRLRLGMDIVNWSALEAFHPVDVINARNLDSDLENLEKIGEPMAALQARLLESTTVTVMFMPVFMETLFPSPRSRLNPAPPGVDLRGALQLLDRNGALTDRRFGPQGAVQVRQVIRSADVTLHGLENMDRLEPIRLVNPMTMNVTLLFQTVRQVGGTYQQVFGPLIAKVEAAHRWFVAPNAAVASLLGPLPSQNHGIVAAGLEYGLPHGNGSQSTFLVEGVTVLGMSEPERRALTPFQRDVFVGWRFARNDEAGKELLLATIVDLDVWGECLVHVSYRQRIGETWTASLGVRVYQAQAVPPLLATGLQLIRNGDHVGFTLLRHF